MVKHAPGAPKRWVVTGGRGAGKTTFCRRAAALAHAAGLDAAGILSPARMEAGEKTGIYVADVRTGAQRLLAAARAGEVRGFPLGRWHFDPDAIRWADEVLVRATPCDILIIDEIGPLELELRRGLTAWESALKSGAYRAALVVVRCELAEEFGISKDVSASLTITSPQQALQAAEAFVRRFVDAV